MKRISKRKRYGIYYQKMMGKEVQMPISEKRPYAEYYENIYLDALNQKKWKEYLRRIGILKKSVKSLGKAPAKGSALVASIKYFAKLVKLASEFEREGILNAIPEDKAEAAKEFTEVIIGITCKKMVITISWEESDGKERLAQYWNQSKENETVTYDNLCLGMYSKMNPKEMLSEGLKVTIEGQKYKIDLLMSPVSAWINNKIKEVWNKDTKAMRLAFSEANVEWIDNLLKAIDKMLA